MQRCCVPFLAVALVLLGGRSPADPGQPPPAMPPETGPRPPAPVRMVQPVQEYFPPAAQDLPTGVWDKTPGGCFPPFTHLGTEYGRMGPGQPGIAPTSGGVEVDLGQTDWAGMWHCLAGRAGDQAERFDFLRCYPPFVREAYQPRCVGVGLRLQGKGVLSVEVSSASGHVLWRRTRQFSPDAPATDWLLDCPAPDLRDAKFLNWVAEPGSRLRLQSLRLLMDFPDIPYPQRVFLISYVKLARCYAPALGVVRDHLPSAAGEFDAIPASGLFCLATCAAWQMGVVDRSFAEQTLRRVHAAVSALPRAQGLLPHFVSQEQGRFRIHPYTEYSTIDTSLYYHAMLLAAQMLADQDTLAQLGRAIREIRFDRLRDADGFIALGLKEDGRTVLDFSWRDWGGEAALVLLLERMALGETARLKMSRSGKVFGGVGFIGEIQSLFYPQFASDQPDAVTGVNWVQARRELLREQMDYIPRTWPGSPAARLGLFGLSAGEALDGGGYAVNGTQMPRVGLIHPHYILMAGPLRGNPEETYRLLRAMEGLGLVTPWGVVEAVRTDLSRCLPWTGSLNASFECLGAYHLWTQAAGQPDQVYEAARDCPLTREAIRAFYPLREGRPS